MPPTIPPINEFPDDGREWRLDWLGAIGRESPGSYEPTLDVILAPVQPNCRNPWLEEHVLGSERVICKIGIGQLPILRTGSIWKDRQLITRTAGQFFRLPDVSITPDNVRIIPTGHQEAENRYVIPPFILKLGVLGRAGLGAHCLAIPYNDDPYGIILPVAEAIRFYYAPSTNLAHLAFNGTYTHDLHCLINPEKSGFDQETGLCILQLRKEYDDDDAWTIARILLDRYALTGAARIFNSISANAVNGSPLFPSCSIPFTGQTFWRVRGIKFRNSTGGDRYLIHEVLRCSAPFPYTNVLVNRDNDGRIEPNGPSVPEDERIEAWGRASAKNESDKLELQSQRAPGNNIAPVKISAAAERFDYLAGKQILKAEKTDCLYKAAQISSIGQLTVTSLNSGIYCDGDNTIAPAQITSPNNRRKGVPPSFAIMEEAAHILCTRPGIRARMHSTYDRFTIPLLAPPNKRQWSYIDSPKRIKRLVWVMEIKTNAQSYYFIDIEPRESEKLATGFISKANGDEISEYELSIIFKLIASSKASWDVSRYNRQGFHVVKRRHTWSTASELAEAIEDLIIIQSNFFQLRTRAIDRQ